MKSKAISYTKAITYTIASSEKYLSTDFWQAVYHKVSSFIRYSRINRMLGQGNDV